VIPAKTFLEKDDVRTSYSHHGMMVMQKQKESQIGISEYELTSFLAQHFGVELQSEQSYINHFISQASQVEDGSLSVTKREAIPYVDGFDTDDGEFVFLEEYDTRNYDDGELFLITPKSPKSLNSQFDGDEYAYLNASHNIDEGAKIKISSSCGTIVLPVKIVDRLRDDTLLIYSGNTQVNKLTTSQHSFEGKCAIFQENRVTITQVENEG
jgi:predicted molibdopterin-dependent oxidoreductase YjgC